MMKRKNFFAETDTKKRSFYTLAEAKAWVEDTLTALGYTNIQAEQNGEFTEYLATKGGKVWDAAIIEDTSFDD